MSKCGAIDCDAELGGRQSRFCSNRCKQAVKYAVSKGEQCKACLKPIRKPIPVLGGFSQYCDRKRCIKERGNV